MSSAQRQLARQVAELGAAAGDDARVRLADCLLDFLAAVLAGTRTVLGRVLASRYASAGLRDYAFALSYLAEIPEFSHGHNRAAGHIGSTTLPAVLALASRGGSPGGALTAAALVGYETSARVGAAFMPRLEQWGSNQTGVIGSLGAAAATARVLGLDASGICSALGVAAYVTPLAPMEGYLSGANSAEAGVATATGMLAAELAAAGITGSPQILDDLYRRIVGTSPPDGFASQSAGGLGIFEVYYKPYPTCRFAQGAIEATLALRNLGMAAGDVDRLEVQVPPRAARICANLPEGPTLTYLQRQFSIPYLVGLAALQGRVSADNVLRTDPVMDRPVIEFAQRHVTVESADALVQYGNVCPTIARVRLKNGAVMEQQVLRPWGCPQAPMTREHLLAKFRETALPLLEPGEVEVWGDLALRLAWTELSQRLRGYLTTQHAPEGVPA